MESLAILPALTLMLPAVAPFFTTLFLLWIFRRFRCTSRTRNTGADSRKLFDPGEIAVLAGILLAFGLFDPASILSFTNPERPMDWIPDLLVAEVLSRTLASFFFRKSRSSFPPGITAIPFIVLILLWPLLRQKSGTEAWTLSLTTLVSWIALHFFVIAGDKDKEDRSRSRLLLLLLATLTFTAISPLSGSLLLGQLGSGLSAVMTATLLFSIVTKTSAPLSESALSLGTLLLIGFFYAEIPFPVIGLLLLALFAGGLGGRILHRTPLPGWGAFLLFLILSGVPLGLAVANALRSMPSPEAY